MKKSDIIEKLKNNVKKASELNKEEYEVLKQARSQGAVEYMCLSDNGNVKWKRVDRWERLYKWEKYRIISDYKDPDDGPYFNNYRPNCSLL